VEATLDLVLRTGFHNFTLTLLVRIVALLSVFEICNLCNLVAF
jgi:hypothetical protein